MSESTLKFINQAILFDDESFSNKPDKGRLSYNYSVEETFSNVDRIDKTLAGLTVHSISLSAGTFTWIYIVCDQTINVRFDGSTDDVVTVEPSVAGTKDGFFAKRGSFTQLSINVPGADSAKVIILAG